MKKNERMRNEDEVVDVDSSTSVGACDFGWWRLVVFTSLLVSLVCGVGGGW